MTQPPDYREALREDQRLLILQHLAEAPDYTAPEHLIRARLGDQGHRLSADVLRGHLAWLDEQGHISLLGEMVQVARLTQRGEDVASGAARAPGIARTRP
jgi:repressor of nif and glnA expression